MSDDLLDDLLANVADLQSYVATLQEQATLQFDLSIKQTETLEDVVDGYNDAFALVTQGFDHLVRAITSLAVATGHPFEDKDLPKAPKLYLVSEENEDE